MTYKAPVAAILRSMRAAAGEVALPAIADGTAAEILEGAAAFAENVIAPLDRIGDRHGVVMEDGHVRTAPGWVAAYQAWQAGGWNGVAAPEAAGGMGLPLLLHFACAEIWSGASLAFGLAPILTSGAIEALERHASQALKRSVLPKLVSGAWTGTMNLTEPQAGSDLSGLATRAERRPDGTYSITGQKIFISFGDHDLTENIIHLVLARLPDAPAGTCGISLFAVPKILIDPDGSLGAPNDLRCAGLERKLGLHAAPTCTMVFGDQGGATGYLVGEENRGLACMFTMMNNARLAVGIEGVAAAERATQLALAYARERRQGRNPAGSAAVASIVEHPDVARMLLTMLACTAAARAICFRTAAALDEARTAPDLAQRNAAADRASVLTPVAKSYATDMAIDVASLGIQVHGGLGYVEGSGAAQILRDCRVFAIYEGTNGIQAIDLVLRKLPLDGGAALAREIEAQRGIARRVAAVEDHGDIGRSLADATESLERVSRRLIERLNGDKEGVLAAATSYLRLFALVAGASGLAASALAAEHDGGDDRARCWALLRFFADTMLPTVASLEAVIERSAHAFAGPTPAWAAALVEPS